VDLAKLSMKLYDSYLSKSSCREEAQKSQNHFL
jgi:hypothetical protein